MPNLLSGSKLRAGGSGDFINLPGAQPALGPTPSTATGYTLITDSVGITRYSDTLGEIAFSDSTIISYYQDRNITLQTSGTGSFVINAPTLFNNTVRFSNTLTVVDLDVTNKALITSGIDSSDYLTGALIVTGGVGISENLNVHGQLIVDADLTTKGTVNLNPVDYNVFVQPSGLGTVTINPAAVTGSIDNMNIGSTIAGTGRFTTLNVTAADQSVSTTTGALIVRGGIGAGGDIRATKLFDNDIRVISTINVGPGLSINTNTGPTVVMSNTGVTSLFASTGLNVSSTTGNVVVWSRGNTLQAITEEGNTTNIAVEFNNLTAATSSTTASVVVRGGLGVAGNAIIAGDLVTNDIVANNINAINATFTTINVTSVLSNTSSFIDNSIYTAGGVGIQQDLTVGGNTLIFGNLTVFGTGTQVVFTVADLGRKVVALSTSAGPAILSIDAGITVGPIANPFVKFLFDGVNSWKSQGGINPSITNTYNLGSTSYRWKDIFSNTLNLSSNQQATSTSSGALIISGGAGIGGNLFTSGLLRSINLTESNAFNQGAVTTLGGVGIAKNLFVGGQTRIQSTTSAISTITGALTVAGGAGFGGDVWARNFYDAQGNIFVTTSTIFNFAVSRIVAGTDTAISTSTGQIVIWNTSTLDSVVRRGNVSSQIIRISNTTDALTSSTGAFVVEGGVSINKTLRVDGNLNAFGTTLFSGTSTGIAEGILQLHKGPDSGWSFDDNEDIGILKHFYTNTADRAFLGRKDTSGHLEWYGNGVEVANGIVTTGTFGVFRTGFIHLLGNIDSTGRTTGTLVVQGGIGVSDSIYAGDIYSNESQVLTAASLGNFGISQITAGTDTAVSANTGDIVVWNTSTLQSVTGRGSVTDNTVRIANTLTVDNVESENLVSTRYLYATTGTIDNLTLTNVTAIGNIILAGSTNPYPLKIISNYNNTSSYYVENQSSGTEASAGLTVVNDLGHSLEFTLSGSNRSNQSYGTGTGYLFLSSAIPKFSVGNASQLDFYTQGIDTGLAPTLSLGTTGTAIITRNLRVQSDPLDPSPEATFTLQSGAVAGTTSITLSNDSLNGKTYTIEVGGNNKSGGSGANVDEGNFTIRDDTAEQYRFIINKTTGNVIIGKQEDDGVNLLQVEGDGTVKNTFTATTATFKTLEVTGRSTFIDSVTVTNTLRVLQTAIFENGLTSLTTSTFNSTINVGSSSLETSITNINTTSPTSIDSFDAALYRSARCLVQITEGGKFQLTEIVLLHDGAGNTYKSEYGIIATEGQLGGFTADVISGRVVLYFEAFDSTPKTINVVRTTISV
jgi:hypothetical protein